MEVNKNDASYFKHKKHVISKVVLSMSTKSKRNELDQNVALDSDSYLFAVDTCTSENICKHEELFVGKIKPCKNLFVQGVGGKIKASGYGSIKIRVTDDENKLNDLIIHNVIYLPESPVNLLSPQKWSLGSEDVNGTGEITVGSSTLLFLDKTKKTKYIPHHPDLGIPIMSVNDGYTKSTAYFHASKVKLFNTGVKDSITLQTSTALKNPSNETFIMPLDDEDQEIEKIDPPRKHLFVDELDQMKTRDAVLKENFTCLDQLNAVDTDDESSIGSNDANEENEFDVTKISKNKIDDMISAVHEKTSKQQKELLHYHYKLKHLPFSVLKRLAKEGIIPSHLEKVPSPLCYGCQMGHQHKKPWRGKGKKMKHIRRDQDDLPGANTSTDQLVSPYGGLIPQV